MFSELVAQMLPYVLLAIVGLIFQSVLPGRIRMFLIYPLSFVFGFSSNQFSNFMPLAFGFGMSARAAVGQYWMCFILEIFLLIAGFAVAFLV